MRQKNEPRTRRVWLQGRSSDEERGEERTSEGGLRGICARPDQAEVREGKSGLLKKCCGLAKMLPTLRPGLCKVVWKFTEKRTNVRCSVVCHHKRSKTAHFSDFCSVAPKTFLILVKKRASISPKSRFNTKLPGGPERTDVCRSGNNTEDEYLTELNFHFLSQNSCYIIDQLVYFLLL